MSFIAFLGCDGSGKSAVITEVTARLKQDGVSVLYGHWRPKAFDSVEQDDKAGTAEDPHGQVPRGVLSSLLKLGWLWLNWWVAWWRGLRAMSRQGVILFDRYHGDMVVDPRRYRYGGPVWVARIASRLMPQPDLVIFLDADPDILLSRKQEVSRDALVTSRKDYLSWVQGNSHCRVIDASKPLDEVVEDALNAIRQVS